MCNLFPVRVRALVADDFGAIPKCRRKLDRGRVRRHDDRCRNAQQSRRQRNALRVIAARVGDDAPLSLLGRQRCQKIIGAAKLEGAHALQVLAFYEDLRAATRIQRRGTKHRGPVRHSGKALRRRANVRKRNASRQTYSCAMWKRQSTTL